MNPTRPTHVSEFVRGFCDDEAFYQFQERSGICMDAGLTIEQADREAYKQIFGIEFID